MTEGRYRVWTGDEWLEMPVPSFAGELIVLTNVNGLVYRGSRREEILLQRRDKPAEVVRGRWELPGGRWRAGESAVAGLERELVEETGITVLAISAAFERVDADEHVAFGIARPLAVVNGMEGAYPSMHVLFECMGEGEPRAVPGETADPGWIPVEDVGAMLAKHRESFVWHTAAMLEAALLL